MVRKFLELKDWGVQLNSDVLFNVNANSANRSSKLTIQYFQNTVMSATVSLWGTICLKDISINHEIFKKVHSIHRHIQKLHKC